jgi:hypothetical protein
VNGSSTRFELMHSLVESPPLDLPLDAWFELHRTVVGFHPDLILELGRGWGNSTCVLTEAAHSCAAEVVSIGFDSERAWEQHTAPRLLPHMGSEWFAPLTVIQGDITTTDFRPFLARRNRVVVFWDAHGIDVASAVLTHVLPHLPQENLVIVDDVWDAAAREMPLPPQFRVGPFASLFDEIEPLWTYLAEAEIPYEQSSRWVSFTAPRPPLRERLVSRLRIR